MGAKRLKDRMRVDAETGETLLECLKCATEKPYTREHFRPRSDGEPSGTCRRCKAAQKKRYAEEGRLSSQPIERRRASWKASRERNRAKHRESARRYKERLKADPVKHAAYLETRRISYRLLREREGKTVKGAPRAKMVPTSAPRLPAAPLARLIERTVANRKAVAGLLADNDGASIEAVCADFSVDARTFRAWRAAGATVQIGTAERVLLNAHVEWYEVYSYDDFADVFLAHGAIA